MARECGTKPPTIQDALEYLKEVKKVFPEGENYQCFLDLLKEYRHKRIDCKCVADHVKKIFEGHNDLILGFNMFLPKGYKGDDQNVRRTDEHGEATESINKNKEDEDKEDDEEALKKILCDMAHVEI